MSTLRNINSTLLTIGLLQMIYLVFLKDLPSLFGIELLPYIPEMIIFILVCFVFKQQMNLISIRERLEKLEEKYK